MNEVIKHPDKIRIGKSDVMVSRQVQDISPQDVAILSNTVAKGTNATELAYFLNVCKSMQLNPFNKEVWCYKDNKQNVVIFAGRDGMLARAQQNPYFAGIRSCEVRENDDWIVNIPKGEIVHRIKHKTVKERGVITCGYAIVFRKDGEPTIEIADFMRYSTGRYVWKSHPEAMIKKVAETAALKKAFGISGVQSSYEWDFSGTRAVPIHSEKISETYVSLLESKLQSSTLGAKRKDELLVEIQALDYSYEGELILEELENNQPEDQKQYMDRKTNGEKVEKETGGRIRYKGPDGNYDKYKNFTDPDALAITIGWGAGDFRGRLESFWRDFEVKKDSRILNKDTGQPLFALGDIIKIKLND